MVLASILVLSNIDIDITLSLSLNFMPLIPFEDLPLKSLNFWI